MSYNGKLRAFRETAGAPNATWNEAVILAAQNEAGYTGTNYNHALLAWANNMIGASNTNLNDALQQVADAVGVANWGMMGYDETLFSPANITSNVLWLDASDSDSITKDGSNLVSQWNDKSGQNNHATATGSVRPLWVDNELNSKPILRSDGGDTLDFANLGINGTQNVSLFLVMKVSSSTSGFDCPIAFGSGSEARFEVGSGGTADLVRGQGSIGKIANDSTLWDASVDAWHNYNLITDSSGWETWEGLSSENSASVASAWSTGAGTYALFSSSTPNRQIIADIAEVIIYTKTLSSAERIRVSNYLSNKWNI